MQLLGVVFVHDYITSEYASLNLSQVSEIKKIMYCLKTGDKYTFDLT